MSISKPVGPNVATATPLGPPMAQTAQKQHAGLLELDAQPSVASIRLPEGAAPKVSAPVQMRRAHIRTPTRHRARTRTLEGSWSPATEQPGIRGLRIGLRARQQWLRDACGLSRLNASCGYGVRLTRRLAADRSHRP